MDNFKKWVTGKAQTETMILNKIDKYEMELINIINSLKDCKEPEIRANKIARINFLQRMITLMSQKYLATV